jgi:Eco57I restriction-modification methylase
MKARDLFTTIHTEGGLLPADLLQRIVHGDKELPGLDDASYHLVAGERLNERISQSWNRLLGTWKAFRAAANALPETDTGTTLTRERWLMVLLQELGYGRLPAARATEIDGKSYAISHFWHHSPMHLVSYRFDLDRRSAGVAGAARTSPHSLVQELLNRSDEHLWGFVSNGLRLRLLRDSVSLTRQAYVEFDLEGMLDGEVYADFVVLWLLCHQSRVEAEKPEECWLERWARVAQERGTRALDHLRAGVEQAINALGSGFLAHPANAKLKEKLRSGELPGQDYYRQLLRLVYRLLFLFVAEDRDLLYDPEATPEARERYIRYYSTTRLRHLAAGHRGTKHMDIYRGLRIVMEKLGSDEGCSPLALPALGSFLWSETAIPDLAHCDISNRDFLEAVRALAFTLDNKILRSVDYKNLGSEELGSIYESLLELHPDLNIDAATFNLSTAGGHERKTTGSYYTPTSLIQCLLDSALDPVLDEAARQPNAEEAILSLKVCDPACGSGHFLIAAAHRMARRLAAIRTGDEEPSPEATRTALRDVISHCIYGVDVNPMAVELCKVSLWMEALEPGKPLTFLDHHIQCGNSLLGTTPALLAQGIPDEAFTPIEGDDKAVVSALRRRNKAEREGQMTFAAIAESAVPYGSLTDTLARLDAIDDASIVGVHDKEERYARLAASLEYRKARLAADAWCAVFVWKKIKTALEPVTHDVFCRLLTEPERVPAATRTEIARLAEQYNFLYWHLAFPDVFRVPTGHEERDNKRAGWNGGFDVVLGNPPWERLRLLEKEWFATRRPEIANAPNATARRKMIGALRNEDMALYEAFLDDRRKAEGESHFVRRSKRYPLCGRGDVNTYAIFAKVNRMLISKAGRVGCIVPSGIATDDTTKFFFADLMGSQSLTSLYDFENREGLFPEIDSRMKFCLLTMRENRQEKSAATDFVFFALNVENLREEQRHFTLTVADLALINPNTRTCPIFRSKRDAEITKNTYIQNPILITEETPPASPWGVYLARMYHMTDDAHLFRTRQQLEGDGFTKSEFNYRRDDIIYFRLYEGRLGHQFNHRFASEHAGVLRETCLSELVDPSFTVDTHYYAPANETNLLLQQREAKCRTALLGYRRVSRNTDERTSIASILPWGAASYGWTLSYGPDAQNLCLLCGIYNSFAFD